MLNSVASTSKCVFFSICDGDGHLLRFSSMISYGYFGDLMNRSEQYRWLGPKRYDVSGVRTFLGNSSYSGIISYNGEHLKINRALLIQ